MKRMWYVETVFMVEEYGYDFARIGPVYFTRQEARDALREIVRDSDRYPLCRAAFGVPEDMYIQGASVVEFISPEATNPFRRKDHMGRWY